MTMEVLTTTTLAAGEYAPATWTDVINPTVGLVDETSNVIRVAAFFLLGFLLARS